MCKYYTEELKFGNGTIFEVSVPQRAYFLAIFVVRKIHWDGLETFQSYLIMKSEQSCWNSLRKHFSSCSCLTHHSGYFNPRIYTKTYTTTGFCCNKK